MRAVLTVEMDGAAFAGGAPGVELARILRNVAEYADGDGRRLVPNLLGPAPAPARWEWGLWR